MDPRERFEDLQTVLRTALAGWQAQLWTALPATVVSFNADAQTIVAQPTVRLPLVAPDGAVTYEAPKQLLDVPVVFPHGGGFTLTFPLQAGDECLIIFSSRCLDGWWQLGGTQVAPDPRMHDLSDGFAIVGPRSQPNALLGVSTTDVQLRSDDGATSIDFSPAGTITITAAADLDIGTLGDVEALVGGDLIAHASGTALVSADGAVTISSLTSISLTSLPGTITANGNVLG